MIYKLTNFAQAYGACAYGTTGYQDGSCSTGTGSTSSSSGNNGLLSNTGFDILLIATIACALIFVALLVRFWRRPVSKATGQAK